MTAELQVPRDRFRAVSALFLRMLQRDGTEAPTVLVTQGKGAQWVAAVFVGAPPPELAEHYLRAGAPGSALPVRASHLGDAHRVAVAPAGEAALELLEADLRRGLESRMRGDAEAWFLAYGEPWRAPELAASPPADPDAPEPGQGPRRPRGALGTGRPG